MQWEFLIALIIAIPVILFPVVLLWCMNIGGICGFISKALKKELIHRLKINEPSPVKFWVRRTHNNI
jgi:hypothetical protein